MLVLPGGQQARFRVTGQIGQDLRIVHQVPHPVQVSYVIRPGLLVIQYHGIIAHERQGARILVPEQRAEIDADHLDAFQHVAAGRRVRQSLVLVTERMLPGEGDLRRVDRVLLHERYHPGRGTIHLRADHFISRRNGQEQRAERKRRDPAPGVVLQTRYGVKAFGSAHVHVRFGKLVLVRYRERALGPRRRGLENRDQNESRQKDDRDHTSTTGGFHRRTQWVMIVIPSYLIRFTRLSTIIVLEIIISY
ncbi:MAG: hypothetical protein A4E30_01650 [Methanomassiliicoccales archaeon PtaB.Bin215]|nr:MAG: hypothetical protein A4E30_01650 [Methanomassiliicoccales archaeon PtaB.Bin215]